jgi:ABC-type oligopeptide transport system ATPase subunit
MKQKAALERLRPSEKADHKTVLEEQGLKREVCTDGTRVKILDDITKWANDRSLASPRVFWLTGQAGSGKTTIAYTIAKRFEKPEDGNANQDTVLGGNFLCSRQFQETQTQTRIIPTIAFQLAHKCKAFANALHDVDNFDAVNHDILSQMKDLLVEPWQATPHPELPLYLIVIDALDEIIGDGGSAFLRNLLKAIDEYDLRGLKFLVTSRPHPKVAALCESFESEAVCRLQDVPIEEAKSDIETYLKTQLPELAGSPELVELGQRAGGLFIYAATAVKYLTPVDSITVGEQTDMLNDFLSKPHEPDASDATSLVDELYRQIMYDAFSKLGGKVLARRLRTLYTFLCTAERTSASIVAALVLEGDDDAARAVLRDLYAVLYTQDDRVFWYHASFPDFIFTQARSNFRIDKKDFMFWCNEPAHHSLLGQSCFYIMKSKKSGLRFNMGNISSSFLFDRDNAVALSEQVNQNISAVLRYSSSYWTHHLPSPQSVNTDSLCCCILEFLQIRVLFWIEAMNLLGLSNQCTPMLRLASQWVLKVRFMQDLSYTISLMWLVSVGTIILN